MNEQRSAKQESMSRRHFIAGTGAVAAGAIVAAAPMGAAVQSAQAQEEDGAGFPALKPALGHVVHNPDICSGCRTCEIVCSMAHEGKASPSLSRLFAFKNVMSGCETTIQTCKQCDGAECVANCPTGALHIDEVSGARVIDPDVCVGCQTCLKSCPADPARIRYDSAQGVCFKCDLCGGEPKCVKYCPMGALTSSWIDYEAQAEDANIFEVQLSGSAKTYTHCELNTLSIEDTLDGIELKGVVWTSHATQFNVINTDIYISAELFAADGTSLGVSDEPAAYVQIPEMSSGKFTLEFTVAAEVADVARCVVAIDGTQVTNAVDATDADVNL